MTKYVFILLFYFFKIKCVFKLHILKCYVILNVQSDNNY